jgi:lysophospholipase L1-like esterase
MRQRTLWLTGCLFLSPIALGEASAPAPAAAVAPAPVIGVSDQPCQGVPTAQTAAHNATADPYQSWMREWLSLDWGQLCRYQPENAHLPPATAARVVFMGDSITDGWKNLDPGLYRGDRLDRGISGQTTGQMLLRFRADVLELHPAVVHILAGTNDIAGNTGATSLAIIEGNIASMAELARAHGVRVILASILPVAQYGWHSQVQPIASVTAMNDWLRAYAAREHYTYVDYYAVLNDGHGGFKADLAYDGVHPNPAGYAAMHALAEAAIAKALASPPR